MERRVSSRAISTYAKPAIELFKKGELSKSFLLIQEGVNAFPEDAALLGVAGKVALDVGEDRLAQEYFELSLGLNPRSSIVNFNYGILLLNQGDLSEAEKALSAVLDLTPNHIDSVYTLGLILQKKGDFSGAEKTYRSVLTLNRNYIEARNNLGYVLAEQKRYNEAEIAYRRGLEQAPNHPVLWLNLGLLYRSGGRVELAEACFKRCLSISPAFAEAHFYFALLLLSLGRYQQGWKHYEWRTSLTVLPKQLTKPRLKCPQWQGENLQGCTLLLWPEQGLGDEIQFVRYVTELRKMDVKRLVLVCKKPLLRWFSSLKEGEDEVVCLEDWQPEYEEGVDYWVFVMSLPLHLGTTLKTIPASLPYLKGNSSAVLHMDRLDSLQGMKIGLVWKGNPSHIHDSSRSLSTLALLQALWDVQGVSFVSLQKDLDENEVNQLAKMTILNLGAELIDFAETAAVVDKLDLIICVDTAIAHLAGAMNKPCWVLLPSRVADWRWLLEGDESPWYPEALRLFRQKPNEGWASVIERVRGALSKWEAS